MTISCQDVERLLSESGKTALADNAEIQDHIGGCETCADLLIQIEERESAESTTSPVVPNAASPSAANQADSPPAPATMPPLPPPVPSAAPPPSLPSAPLGDGPKVAAKPTPREWLPSLTPSGLPTPGLPPPGAFATSDPWGSRSPRMSIKIKPIHFWIGSIASLVLGAMLVLIAVIVVNRQTGLFTRPLPPSATDASTADGDAVAPDLIAPAQDDQEFDRDQNGGRASLRGKNRHKSTGARTPDAPTPTKSPAGKELTQADVLTGVKDNVPKLGPCLETARKHNELSAGKHTLIFSFTVMPNGSVKGGKLDGPTALLKTSLPACFATKMRAWKFPTSGAGASIKNFPLPVNLN